MKDSFEIQVGTDGTMETIYQEGIEAFAEDMGADVVRSCRASNVEWEAWSSGAWILNARFPAEAGWSVRSAQRPELALRIQSSLNAGVGSRYIDEVVCSDNGSLAIALFETREEALRHEVKFFWQLLERNTT